MTSVASGEPPRPTNLEILEVRDKHAESVTVIYWRVAEMDIEAIEI